jgi:hypothetical protein
VFLVFAEILEMPEFEEYEIGEKCFLICFINLAALGWFLNADKNQVRRRGQEPRGL